MARKLACLFYRLLTKGQTYVDKGAQYYESLHREQQIRSVLKRATQLGLQIIQPAGQTE
jgi:transposase